LGLSARRFYRGAVPASLCSFRLVKGRIRDPCSVRARARARVVHVLARVLVLAQIRTRARPRDLIRARARIRTRTRARTRTRTRSRARRLIRIRIRISQEAREGGRASRRPLEVPDGGSPTGGKKNWNSERRRRSDPKTSPTFSNPPSWQAEKKTAAARSRHSDPRKSSPTFGAFGLSCENSDWDLLPAAEAQCPSGSSLSRPEAGA
jgi:hypothetical protein